MNFEDKMKDLLIQNGMFGSQADEVIAEAKVANCCESMMGRWGDDVSGYPEMMVNVLWLSVKTVALKWLEENAPEAWFKPMFMDDQTPA